MNKAATTNQHTTTWKDAAALLQAGKVGIIPTDTVYGLVGSARLLEVVERISVIKQRPRTQKNIILLPSHEFLADFGVLLTSPMQEKLEELWPGAVSVEIPCFNEQFSYLHHNTNCLAFRVPDTKKLQALLKQTGPLVAPSANPNKLATAMNITEARLYFGNTVDFYIDGGVLDNPLSRLLRLREDGSTEVLR